jgi:hypothetical protein
LPGWVLVVFSTFGAARSIVALLGDIEFVSTNVERLSWITNVLFHPGFLIATLVVGLIYLVYGPGARVTDERATPTWTPVVVKSDGLLWRYRGPDILGTPMVRAHCPEHDIELDVRTHHDLGAEIKEMRTASHDLDDTRYPGDIYCVGPAGEGHVLALTESKKWDEAEKRARRRMQSELDARRASRQPRGKPSE